MERTAVFRRYYRFTLIVALTCFLQTCGGGESDDDSDDDDQPPSASTSFFISVTEGGEVVASDGETILTIEENSVVNDSEISLNEFALEQQPEQERLASKAYQFSASNFELLDEAILTLPMVKDVPDDHSVLIAELRNGHWFERPGTEYDSDDNTATARIYNLSTYAVVLRPITQKNYSINEACVASATQQTISFVHTSDLHSNYGDNNQYAKIRAFYEQTKLDNPYTLFTNAGDDYEKGSVAEQLSSGVATLEATQAMQFDVRIVGNHDFAWGKQQLMDFVRDPHGIVLASNTIYQADDYEEFAAAEYVEVEIGCMKIGMFSLVASPWNEFDREFLGDYLEHVRLDFWWNQVAERIIEEHEDEVDLMVLISHLGRGTDEALATYIDDVDIILGGHSHQGVSFSSNINDTLIVQPEFNADGVTRLDISYDLTNKRIINFNHNPVLVEDLTQVDVVVANKIGEIMERYAPEAHKDIAELQQSHSVEDISQIAVKAGLFTHASDAILLDGDLAWPYWSGWKLGGVTQQMTQFAYRVERQKPNTPGFDSLYQAIVTGEQLTSMRQAQPDWNYAGVEQIEASQNYSVLLHKAAALNPTAFFGEGETLQQVNFMSETWYAIDKYVRYRSSQCLFVDSDETLPSCNPDISTSAWDFSNQQQPLTAHIGPGQLSFFDPDNTSWEQQSISFATASELNIAIPAQGDKAILSFSALRENEGLILEHFSSANGDFASIDKMSNYTLILDVLWPQESDGEWRALMQTNLANTDDADWFVENTAAGGVGISQYFGQLQPNEWHRIGLVVRASPEQGKIDLFIDGIAVGQIENINERWALVDSLLMLTDDNNETAAGYLSGILFSGRAYSENEMQALGSAQDGSSLMPSSHKH